MSICYRLFKLTLCFTSHKHYKLVKVVCKSNTQWISYKNITSRVNVLWDMKCSWTMENLVSLQIYYHESLRYERFVNHFNHRNLIKQPRNYHEYRKLDDGFWFLSQLSSKTALKRFCYKGMMYVVRVCCIFLLMMKCTLKNHHLVQEEITQSIQKNEGNEALVRERCALEFREYMLQMSREWFFNS